MVRIVHDPALWHPHLPRTFLWSGYCGNGGPSRIFWLNLEAEGFGLFRRMMLLNARYGHRLLGRNARGRPQRFIGAQTEIDRLRSDLASQPRYRGLTAFST